MNAWSALPMLAVVAPMACALGLAIVRAGPRTTSMLTIATTGLGFVLCMVIAVGEAQQRIPEMAWLALVPPVHLAVRVDALGALFALTVSLLYLLASVYAARWLEDDAHPRLYQVVALACLGPMLLVAFAGNLVTLLVGYELFSLASFLLIAHRRTPTAICAGVKYLLYVLPGAMLCMAGTVIVFFATGSVTFSGGGLPAPETSSDLMVVAWVCLVLGFGVKAALFPLHGWVPDAHPAAPAPFSAILSGVMVASGLFAIIRVIHEIFGAARLEMLGLMPWLVLPAAVGIVVSGVLAVGTDELKRRLAYSTISQMGYATLAVALLEPWALTGALVHISTHAFLKGGLFFVAGTIALGAGIHHVSQLQGLATRMPVSAAALTLLAIGLAGIPPLAAFPAKWLLISGAAAAHHWLALSVLLTGSLLAAAYLWPLMSAPWKSVPSGEARTPVAEPMNGLRIAACASCLLALLLGVGAAWTGYPLALARRAAAALIGGG